MAPMYPERIPESVRGDPFRAAERDVHECLADNLDHGYTAFCWTSWVAHDTRGARDGEGDFVIAHPDLDVLVLEVKGGGIEYDAARGTWVSVDPQHVRHQVPDPFEQARKSQLLSAGMTDRLARPRARLKRSRGRSSGRDALPREVVRR